MLLDLIEVNEFSKSTEAVDGFRFRLFSIYFSQLRCWKKKYKYRQ